MLQPYINFKKQYETKEFGSFDIGRDCDICRKAIRINKSWYHDSDFSDICYDCSYKCLKTIFKEIIRRNFSTEEKPLKWNCYKCNKKLGGGCDWFTNEDLNIDICENCFNPDAPFYSVLQHPNVNFVLEEPFELNNRSYGIIERSGELLCYLDVPSEFLSNVFEPLLELNEEYCDLIDEGLVRYTCAYIDDAIKDEDYAQSFSVHSKINVTKKLCRESILHWTILEKATDLCGEFQAMSGLLININDNQQVASYVIDDHGRVSVDVIFKSWDNYKKARAVWEEFRKTVDDEKYKNIVSEYCSKTGKLPNYELMHYVNFSAYCRLLSGLGFYYG